MKKIRIALIGVSGYGKVHFNYLKQLAEQGAAEFAAAVVINPDQVPDELAILRTLGAKVYPSTDAMYAELSGKLDLVCLPTGIAFHESMTEQALANGANVLVEKPAAGSAAAIRRMMEAEQKYGHFVAVGFQHIYAREIQFIKQYLLSGRIGRVKRIVSMGLWPRADQYYHRNNWAGRLAAADGTPILDSPVNNAFAHYLNLQLFLSGDTFATSAHAESVEGMLCRARPEIETFDTSALRFRTANGVELLSLFTHTAGQGDNPSMRIECENGAVYWKLDSSWNIRNAEGAVLHSGIVEAPHMDMFRDMIRKIGGEPVFTCPLSLAIEHTLCIEMLTKELTPIVLKESAVRREKDGQYILDNISEVFRDCCLNAALPQERGVNWK